VSKAQIQFNCEEDPVTKKPINLTFSWFDLQSIEQGDELFKLALKRKMRIMEENKEQGSFT
jgi:hypothetical protein